MVFKTDSVLLNDVYIPHYSLPKKTQIIDYQTEISTTGIKSVINLMDSDNKLLSPFIDLSEYNIDSKDWQYYDTNRLPYKLTYDKTLSKYKLTSLVFDNTSTIIDNTDLLFNNITNELYIESTENWVKYSPIILVVEGKAAIDKTDYVNLSSDKKLIDTLDDTPQFYYDFDNKIYTNINFDNYKNVGEDNVNTEFIKLFIFQSTNSINVKCRMKSNSGDSAYTTPSIDYYILKLNGQFLRGN